MEKLNNSRKRLLTKGATYMGLGAVVWKGFLEEVVRGEIKAE
jgi:DNA-directed RNA polymerase subunit E'/Rpb7